MARGKIYILTNDAMPDFIKIGFTSADDVVTRMKQLDTTGLPLPFRLYACVEVEMAHELEKLAHEVFATQRARSNREFFLMEPETAVKYLQAVSMNDASARWIAAGQEMIDESGNRLAEDKVVKPRRANFTFSSADVPVGEFIKFARDSSFVAQVISDTEVIFEGEVTRLSPLARVLFDRLNIGNASGVYAGPDHFTFEDEILSDRRRRLSTSLDAG